MNWKKVSASEPPKDKWVLICVPYEPHVAVAYRTDANYYENELWRPIRPNEIRDRFLGRGCIYETEKVIGWMELPDGPKE